MCYLFEFFFPMFKVCFMFHVSCLKYAFMSRICVVFFSSKKETFLYLVQLPGLLWLPWTKFFNASNHTNSALIYWSIFFVYDTVNHYQEFRSWQLSNFLLAVSIENNNNPPKNKQCQQLLKLENFPSAILWCERPA